MATTEPKIVMKKSTRISLNERFTTYRQQTQEASSLFRQKIQAQRKASQENRRLAQQMANRPTVMAALRIKKRSIQQRLGSQKRSMVGQPGVMQRLDYTGVRGFGSPFPRSGFRSSRGGGGNFLQRNRSWRGRRYAPGTSPMLKSRLGTPNARFGSPQKQRNFKGGRGRNRNFNRNQQQPFRGRRGPANSARPGPVNSARRGTNVPNRGGRNNKGPVPTKQELDNELDQYMAETKGPLGEFLNF